MAAIEADSHPDINNRLRAISDIESYERLRRTAQRVLILQI